MVVVVQALMLGISIAAVCIIAFFEPAKVSDQLVWATFVITGLLMYEPFIPISDSRLFQTVGVSLLVAEILGLSGHKKEYEEDMEKERSSVLASITSRSESTKSDDRNS